MLLQLADPDQILSLNNKSSDPRYASADIIEQARRYHANQAQVEEILYLKPDLVLADPFWQGNKYAALFAKQGIQIVQVPYPQNWNQGIENAGLVAEAIGRGDHGSALINDTRARIQRLRAAPRPLLTLYLRPNGGTAGRETYVDDLMQALGLRNMASELGMTGWASMPLEELIQTQPDLFLLGYFDLEQPLLDSGHSRHPRLQAMLERSHHFSIPIGAWGCGGAELIEIAEDLAAQIDRLDIKGSGPQVAP